MTRKLIVFTDLDGTLLDHDTYRFDAADQALEQLKKNDIPLILNTSKTMAEVLQIRETLDNHHPFIVENGSLIAVPDTYFTHPNGFVIDDFSQDAGYPGYCIQRLGGNRDEIVSLLAEIRRDMNLKFIGFADMSVSELTACTGLSNESATLAKERLSTEPILWQDSDEAFLGFESVLKTHGLCWVQGGRFLSISEPFDKRDGVRRLIQLYENEWHQKESPKEHGKQDALITVALGDSPNDQGMLDTAHIAVIIQSDRSENIEVSHPETVIRTAFRGPQGWQEAMEQILADNL